MKTIRVSRIAALLLAVFLIIGLFPTAGLAEDDPGEAAPVAESVPEAPPAEPEPEEEVEAQSVEETNWVPEETADVEIPDEAVPEAVPSLPEEQVQDENTDERIEPEPSEPAGDNPPADPPENSEDQVQAQSIDDDIKAMEAEKPEKNEEPEQDDPNKSDDSDDSPAAFTVTLEDYTCKYDGEEHSSDKTPVCVPSDETTTYAFAFSFEEEGEYTDDLASLKKTDAGEYTIYVKATNQDGEEAATTAKLIINQREVKVKVADSEAVYNGSTQYGSKVLVFENVLEGHEASIDYEPATGTEVGIHDNGTFDEDTFKVIVKPENEEDTPEEEETGEKNTGEEDTEEKENNGDGDGENTTDDGDDTPETVVTSNYILTEMTPGKLVINPVDVSISSADAEWTYDGYEHSKPVYTVLCGDETMTPDDESGLVFTLPETGDTLTILEPAKVKNVSDTAEGNTFSYELTNADQYDVQKNYGTLTIIALDQATVTITGNSDTKTYSGSAQSVSGYKYNVKVGETVIPSDDFTVTLAPDKKAEAAGTDTGTYAMGLTKDDFTVANPNCSNIIVEYTDGVLTIQQLYVKVTITGHNNKSVYDGKEHSVSGYDVACSVDLYYKNRESNISFTGNAYAARTNVSSPSEREGTTYMGLKEDQFKNKNTNFNAQFEVIDGYQTIERKRLVVKTGGGEKVYDGKPLKNTEASLSGLLEGETATVVATGEQTNTGKSYNTYEIKWGTAKVGNYILVNSRGVLTVTRAPLSIQVKPQSYEYNGKPQGEDNKIYTDPAEINEKVEVKGLQGKDKLLSITLNGQGTEVGTYNNKDKNEGIVLTNVKIGTDPKASTTSNRNYEIHWNRGTLTITEADSGNSSTGGSSKTSGSSSSSGSSSGSSYSSYDYSSGNNYYSGGYSNTTNYAQAESAVVSYEVPLEIGVVNTGTGESYE